MTEERSLAGLSAEELEAQGATALPDKEVVSVLDLNADLDHSPWLQGRAPTRLS
jgi:hypothetical protein